MVENSTMESVQIKDLNDLKKNVDDLFLISNAIIVCLMQCGFACLEAGSVRAKNATNIMMKNMLDMFISAICYWLLGYSFAFGSGSPFIGLGPYLAGIGLTSEKIFSHWFFQFVFAATAATIVSGAVAERCSFTAYLVYSAVISGIVYPVASHWAWHNEGWLQVLGYMDFAGSGVVHLLGGICALSGAVLLGPRIGRFDGTQQKRQTQETGYPFAGHSTPLVGLGGMILIAGFLAFNGGSLGHISQPGDGEIVAHVLCNTALGGAGGALSTLVLVRSGLAGGGHHWSFLASLNGALTGMVTVCASADHLEMWSSVLLGLISGPIYCAVGSLLTWFCVDDPLDAVAVHGGGGLWGLLGGSLLRSNALPAGDVATAGLGLACNALGALAIILWAGATCLCLFGTLKVTGLLRVSPEVELRGMDVSKHSEPAYPGPPWHMTSRDATSRKSSMTARPTVTDCSGKDTASSTQKFENFAYTETE